MITIRLTFPSMSKTVFWNVAFHSFQDCPEGSRNFRYEQCEAFNNRTLDGRKYKWVPYVPGRFQQTRNVLDMT